MEGLSAYSIKKLHGKKKEGRRTCRLKGNLKTHQLVIVCGLHLDPDSTIKLKNNSNMSEIIGNWNTKIFDDTEKLLFIILDVIIIYYIIVM